MATGSKINDFVLNLAEVIDLDGDAWHISLSNTAPASETSNPTADGNGVLANVTEISYTNYSDDLTADRILTAGNLTHTQSGGTLTFDYTADIVITASGGALATWRYLYVWDTTPTSPADPLLGVWDHGSGITLADGDTATIAFNASGIFTMS